MEIGEDIRERINGFAINRIPDRVKKEFLEFSEAEFMGDRGMTLKFLWDFYTGVIHSGIEHLEHEVQELKMEIYSLKQKDEQKKEIRRLDGRKVN